MERIDLPNSDAENYDFYQFCETVIEDTEIILMVCNMKVRYVRNNGFKMFDLFNFANKQYLIEHNYFDEDENSQIYEDDEVDWDANHTEYLEHTLHGFNYDADTKMVTCIMSH